MSDLNDERLRNLYAPLAAREPQDRTGCPAPEMLQALVDRDGSEQGRLTVLNHVMSCAACRKEFDMLNALAHAHTETEASYRPTRFRGFSSHPIRLTVMALAASVVAAVSVQVIRHRDQPDVLRDAEQRTHFNGPYPVSLLSPTTATLDVATGITFIWHPSAGALRYTIEVIDTDGTSVFTMVTNDTSVVFPDAEQKLNKSTHYQWWVRAANMSGIEQRSEMRELRVRD